MRNLIACRWLLIAAASFFATAATAQDVVSVTLNPSEKTVTVDSSFYMGATAFDSANQPVPDEPFTWASTNRAVARVDESGLVLAVAAGDASIVATASNGVSGNATIHVTGAPSRRRMAIASSRISKPLRGRIRATLPIVQVA